jgi:hypothetical protein
MSDHFKKGVWSFYDPKSGQFLDRTYSGLESTLLMNTPAGCVAWLAKVDCYSQRLNVVSNQLEDYQPPSPGDDYEWIHDDERGNRVRRWRLKLEIQQARELKAANLSRITELESRQHRRVRELLEASDPQLQEISREIAALREGL